MEEWIFDSVMEGSPKRLQVKIEKRTDLSNKLKRGE
jgi:hypothetical protein